MKFSVLVPVYNVEKYLEQCLDSILKQTYQDFELILVDDGSIDQSGTICDKYREQYSEIVKVIHKENQGLISARRVGIKEATGEFCVFIDSDDFVEPNLLEVINSYLNTDFEVDILLYSFVYYRNKVRENRCCVVAEDGYTWVGTNKKELYEKISCGSDITSIWTKAIRTSILKEDPTDYTMYYGKNMAEDLLQSLYPLTVARKVMYANKPLYNYRINDESISHNYDMKTICKKNTIHVYEKIIEYLPLWEMNNDEIQAKIKAKWFNDTMYLFMEFYKMTSEKTQRKTLISYDWKSWLPKGNYNKSNPFINRKYFELYTYLQRQDIRKINKYFLRDKFKKQIKKIKRVIKGKIKNG